MISNSENLQNFSINFDYRYEGGRLRQATAKYIIAERHSEGMLVSSFEEHVNISYNDKNNTVEIIYDNENQPTKVKYLLTWK